MTETKLMEMLIPAGRITLKAAEMVVIVAFESMGKPPLRGDRQDYPLFEGGG